MAKKHALNKKNLGNAVVRCERKLAKVKKEYQRTQYLRDMGKATREDSENLWHMMTQLEEDLADLRMLYENWDDSPSYCLVAEV